MAELLTGAVGALRRDAVGVLAKARGDCAATDVTASPAAARKLLGQLHDELAEIEKKAARLARMEALLCQQPWQEQRPLQLELQAATEHLLEKSQMWLHISRWTKFTETFAGAATKACEAGQF